MGEEQTRDFKGVWIPREVWLDSRLTALDKMILTEVDSLDMGERGCFASNQYLAEFCGCSERKVSESISKLKDLGYLYVKSFDGRTRELKSSLVNYVSQSSKNCEAETQNLRHNNIDNNIDNNNKRKKENKSDETSKISFDNLIDNYTDNETLRDELKNHLKVRKMKKALTNRAIELSLNKLDKLVERIPDTNKTKVKIEIVQESIDRGWTGFFPLAWMKNNQSQQQTKPIQPKRDGSKYAGLEE